MSKSKQFGYIQKSLFALLEIYMIRNNEYKTDSSNIVLIYGNLCKIHHPASFLDHLSIHFIFLPNKFSP